MSAPQHRCVCGGSPDDCPQLRAVAETFYTAGRDAERQALGLQPLTPGQPSRPRLRLLEGGQQ